MELNIYNIPPTICLNMIVKNESHIIKNTLENLCNKIQFSYWVICDTGSTDNTQQIITDFFNDKNIPGELHNNEWKNFAHNRNIALNEAFDKTDLLLVFDADDEIRGNIIMPKTVDSDGYSLNFGNSDGISYQRILLINNKIRWTFKSVIHEYINCLKPNPQISYLEGNYYVESGRSGSRNNDPNKYLKDATILEESYYEAQTNNDPIYMRYGFYCANSYKDAGKTEEAIKWYKITLNNENWDQEKYMCCLNLYNLFNILGEKEKGLYYLVESFHYDLERMECVYLLIKEYCCRGLNTIAYNYYCIIKDFYENKYLQTNNIHKLFVENDKPNFYLPYYMIIVADKVKDIYPEAKQTIIKMYEIIFTKKYYITEDFFIGNLLYNLQFFIHFCCETDNFITLFQNYILYLEDVIKINLYKHQFLKKFKKYSIKFKSFEEPQNLFSENECKNSNKILFYTGFSNIPWNNTYSQTNSLGGSETAVINLAKTFPNNYEIYICGDVAEETCDNIYFVSLNNLCNLVNKIPFYTVIVSRYIGFYEMFPKISFYQSYIWGHDIALFNYGCNLDVSSILDKWLNKINGCVCQTEWHKILFIQQYPQLTDKIFTINNGILVDKFIHKPIKFTNRFIYTSCAERGLDRLLELWSQIINVLPDAELLIASYNKFPQNEYEIQLDLIIKKYESIKHVGCLDKDKLYQLMSTAEYWLYPTNFNETSCITSMEMLMSEVICIYYPIAGLIDTLGDYGIPVQRNEEISTILNLSTKQKCEIRKKGKEYALSCCWKNRANQWQNILILNKIKWYFYCPPNFEIKMIQKYIYNLNNIYPEYSIHLTNDKNDIITENPLKITFVYEVFDLSIINYLPNTEFSFLNTEPLNIYSRLQNIKNIQYLNHDFGYYDYSQSNLYILTENNIEFKYKIILPYICSSSELLYLQKINTNTEKVFDFGIIKTSCGEITYRRQNIIDFLKSYNFSINIIEGWGDDRDNELAKCKLILNIHGHFNNFISMIFEHLRCDRLLESGFNILSETSYNLSVDFINKYPNLKIIDYEDFCNINIIIDCYNNTLSNNEHNQYVLNILNSHHTHMHWLPQQHITFLEKLFLEYNPDNMVIYDIGSNVLHWTHNAQTIWKKSKIYLFDGMTEMKLFYDEYNKNNKNNITYNYNIGVLCDEDYKKICFFQNEEFSGGNSYYKEIGHINSHKIFTEKNIKQKIGMKLKTIVEIKNIPAPDLIKIDVQGAELDILKGSIEIINKAKYLIVELQHTKYNEGAPLYYETCNYLIYNGWDVYADKFSNNGPDADWCFINKKHICDKNKINKKVIDCFIFYNELDMLNYRLNILTNVVDYFVLVESTHTFIGKEKKLYYNENKHLFEKFNHKIIHIIVDDFPHIYPNININNDEQWINEKFQRNTISRGIDKLNLNNEDIITIMDVDEIPNPKILTQIKTDNNLSINCLEMDFYYYNLNSKMDHKWYHSKILTFKKYIELNITCDNIRFFNCSIINNGGWHLSYFGNEEFIKNKVENFSHQEFNKIELTNKENIKNKIKNKLDLFDRSIKICYINIDDNTNLPPEYDNYLSNYYHRSVEKKNT